MSTITTVIQWAKRLRSDQRGQDLIEYALMAALVVVAVTSGLAPWITPTLSQIFSRVTSALSGTPT